MNNHSQLFTAIIAALYDAPAALRDDQQFVLRIVPNPGTEEVMRFIEPLLLRACDPTVAVEVRKTGNIRFADPKDESRFLLLCEMQLIQYSVDRLGRVALPVLPERRVSRPAPSAAVVEAARRIYDDQRYYLSRGDAILAHAHLIQDCLDQPADSNSLTTHEENLCHPNKIAI